MLLIGALSDAFNESDEQFIILLKEFNKIHVQHLFTCNSELRNLLHILLAYLNRDKIMKLTFQNSLHVYPRLKRSKYIPRATFATCSTKKSRNWFHIHVLLSNLNCDKNMKLTFHSSLFLNILLYQNHELSAIILYYLFTWLLKDIRDMVGNAYSREELAESSVEGGKGSIMELNSLRMHSLLLD